MTERGTIETLETMLAAEQWALRERQSTAQVRHDEVSAARNLWATADGLVKKAEQRIRSLEEAIAALRDRL